MNWGGRKALSKNRYKSDRGKAATTHLRRLPSFLFFLDTSNYAHLGCRGSVGNQHPEVTAITPPGRSSIHLSIAELAVQCCTRNAMDGLLPKMCSRRPPEHQRNVCIRERVLNIIPSGDTDLQRR